MSKVFDLCFAKEVEVLERRADSINNEENDIDAYWRYDVPNKMITFIGLDTSINFSSYGEIDEKQIDWLVDNLNDISLERNVIIFMHHPAIIFNEIVNKPGMDIFLLKNHEEIINIFNSHKNIKLVISGHTHSCGHLKNNDIHYVSCPSIISWPNMYTRFKIEKNRFMFTNIPIKNNEYIKIARRLITTNESALNLIGSEDEIIEYHKPLNKFNWIDF